MALCLVLSQIACLARGRDQYLLAACDQTFVLLTTFTLERNAIFLKIEKKISYQIVKFHFEYTNLSFKIYIQLYSLP